MIGDSKIQFIIVCQKGDLEIKACILLASLRVLYGDHVEVHFAIPGKGLAELSKHTHSLIDELNVNLFAYNSVFLNSYPIGNKISAIASFPASGKRIFLDSDILALKSCDLLSLFQHDLALKPADRLWVITKTQQWGPLYDKFGLQLPSETIETTVSRVKTLPYYNSGVLVINQGVDLGPLWEQYANKLLLEHVPGINHENIWIDQITLPLVISKSALRVQILDESYNYPAHLRQLSKDAYFIHYHNQHVLRREPALNSYVIYLSNLFSSLKTLLSSSKQFSFLLEGYNTPYKKKYWGLKYLKRRYSVEGQIALRRKNFIISGIPRSGTSLLCRILDDQKGIAVINEPNEIIELLKKQKIPVELPVFLDTVKTKILDRVPIFNKAQKGKIVTDTIHNDRRSKYIYTIDNPNFYMGAKNTLSLLLRLDDLVKVFDRDQLIICIRKPKDIIASWKNSFSHLRNVRLDQLPAGSINDPFISKDQRGTLLSVHGMKNLCEKRAVFLSLLFKIILKHLDDVTIIHYEKMIINKSKIINDLSLFETSEVCSDVDAKIMDKGKGLSLSEKERHYIDLYCQPVYRELISQINV